MGVYDTFTNGNRDVQLKCGPCAMKYYRVGDKTPDYADGLYAGYGGVAVIVGGKFVALFERIMDKWGGELALNLDDVNPIAQAVKELNATPTPPSGERGGRPL